MDTLCKFCRKKFIKEYTAQIFCSLVCSNRFNLNNKNTVTVPLKYNSELAEFFGILLGDGSVTKYYVKIYLNFIADADYVPFVEKLSQRLFPGAPVTRQQRINEGTAEIQISSKDVCDYLRGIGFDPKSRCIPTWITRKNKFVEATMRGLFDTEGSVGIKYFHGKNGNYFYKQLIVTNKNKNILYFLERYLVMLGYKPTKNSEKNIYISNKSDINRYFNNIGSHNPKIIGKIKIEEINGFRYGGGLRRMVRHQS